MKRLALMFVMAALAGCNCNYSNGARVGVVTKFSRKGAVCKTYEGEMNAGGFRNSSDGEGNTTVVANIFLFTVKSRELADEVERAMESGKRVKLTYEEVAFRDPCSTSSGYFVSKVEVLP